MFSLARPLSSKPSPQAELPRVELMPFTWAQVAAGKQKPQAVAAAQHSRQSRQQQWVGSRHESPSNSNRVSLAL